MRSVNNSSDALYELIDNAIQANSRNIDIVIIEKNALNQSYKINEILVLDDGCGMSKEILENCFESPMSPTALGWNATCLAMISFSQCLKTSVYS